MKKRARNSHSESILLAIILFFTVFFMGAGRFLPTHLLNASALDLDSEYLKTLGGPTEVGGGMNLDDSSRALVAADFPSEVDMPDNRPLPSAVNGESIMNSPAPVSGAVPDRNGLIIYKVRSRDTLSSVAVKFGISVNTIIWANRGIYKNFLKPGQELVILPVSGVLHQVETGETFESIANLYSVDQGTLKSVNRVGPSLDSGEQLIIPGGHPLSGRKALANAVENLPDLVGYFKIPTTGWNWGQLHPNNAVDIANGCGTPIYAAADGLVVEAKDSGSNSGYGHFVKIEHPNDTATLYAHMDGLVVGVGDLVRQGQLIGDIGNTGNTHGPTGCHLHFEVYGARNPFAKY